MAGSEGNGLRVIVLLKACCMSSRISHAHIVAERLNDVSLPKREVC